MPQLASTRQAVRKRTIVALSVLLVQANSNAYNGVVDHLLEGLENPQNPGAIRTYIQCLASIWYVIQFKFINIWLINFLV